MVGNCAASRITHRDRWHRPCVTNGRVCCTPYRGHEHRPRQRLHGSACFFCVQRCMHTDSCGTRHTCWFCFRKSRPGSTTSCGAAYRSLQSPARNLQPPAAKITRDGSPSDTGGNKGRWLPASFQGALSLHEAIVDMAIP